MNSPSSNSGGSAGPVLPPPPHEFFVVLPDGSCTPATAKTLGEVLKQHRTEARKQARIRRHDKAVEVQMALEDRTAARRLMQELAEMERDAIRWAARLRVRLKPEPPKSPTSDVVKRVMTTPTRIRITPSARAASSWATDDFGMRGVIWQQSYLGRKSARFYRGAARDNWEYEVRDEAVLLDTAGEPVIISNMGEDWVEIGAAWQALEDASTRKNAKIQIRAIAPFDADASEEETIAALRHFCKTVLEPLDLPYSAVIHRAPDGGDERNRHPHISFSLRPMRRVEAYCWEVADEVRGELDGRDGVQMLRHLWAHAMSEAAEQARSNRRYTGLGYGARGLPFEAGAHLGEARSAMVRRGDRVWAHERNRIKSARNAARRAISDADHKIAALTEVRDAALAQQAAERAGERPIRVLKATPPVAKLVLRQAAASLPMAPVISRAASSTGRAERKPLQASTAGPPISARRTSGVGKPIPSRRTSAAVAVPARMVASAAGFGAKPHVRARSHQTFQALPRSVAVTPPPAVPQHPASQPIRANPIDRIAAMTDTFGDLTRWQSPRRTSKAVPKVTGRVSASPNIVTPTPDWMVLLANAVRAAAKAKAAKAKAARAKARVLPHHRWADQNHRPSDRLPTIAETPTRAALEACPRERHDARARSLGDLDVRRLAHLRKVDAYVADYGNDLFEVDYPALKAIHAEPAWQVSADIQAELTAIRAEQQAVMEMMRQEAARRPLKFAKSGMRFWPRDLEPEQVRRLDRWASDPGFQHEVFAIEQAVRQAHDTRDAAQRQERAKAAPAPAAAQPVGRIADGFGGWRDTPPPMYNDTASPVRLKPFEASGKPSEPLLRLLHLVGRHPHAIAIATDGWPMVEGKAPALLAPLLHGWRHNDEVVGIVTETIRLSRAEGSPTWPSTVETAVHAFAVRHAGYGAQPPGPALDRGPTR